MMEADIDEKIRLKVKSSVLKQGMPLLFADIKDRIEKRHYEMKDCTYEEMNKQLLDAH